jgi:hypothetical protein
VAKRHKPPSGDAVEEMVAAAAGVRGFIVSQVQVVEDGYSPHLLPPDIDKLLPASVQLAALLVVHNNFVQDSSDINSSVISLWSILKSVKLEIPIHLLLSADSVTHYLQQETVGAEDVWWSLACLLVETIERGIAASDVVEALWMCRIQQSSVHTRQRVIDGSAIFLAMWYDQDLGQREGVTEASGIWREVCFVRLLKIVATELDSHSIGTLRHHPALTLLSL